jgi:hypothetical protein
MSRVPWHLFQDRQPRAHLVVGVLVEAPGFDYGDELAVAQYVLKRLVSKQKPGGDYAATVARDTGHPEVYFAFDDEADARKFAAVLEAETTAKYPGWASQRAFDLDGAKLRTLEASLPLPKRDPRRDTPNGSSLRIRVRRGPRTPVARYDEE